METPAVTKNRNPDHPPGRRPARLTISVETEAPGGTVAKSSWTPLQSARLVLPRESRVS